MVFEKEIVADENEIILFLCPFDSFRTSRTLQYIILKWCNRSKLKIQNGMDMSSTILTILKNCKIDQWELWRQAFTEYKRRMRRIFRRTMLNERSVLASVRMKEQNRFGSYTCTLVNSKQLISFFVLER